MGPTDRFFRHHLRHRRQILLTSPRSLATQIPNPNINLLVSRILFNRHHNYTPNPSFLLPSSSRSFSWVPWTRFSYANGGGGPETLEPCENESELGILQEGRSNGADDGSGFGSDLGTVNGYEIGNEMPSLGLDGLREDAWYAPAVDCVISCLDNIHNFTGLPWWVVISASTLALRATLLPVLILQLKKGEKMANLMPQLPPPLPPSQSGRSYREQYLIFQSKRRELGCPSYLWSFAYFIVQLPCFLLWMTSIRKMCLDHHHGFDSGGALWFKDLTDLPDGILGSTFPVLIAGLHYINIQVSFQTFKLKPLPGMLGLLAKYYKIYLDILAIPLLLIGFNIPQGSLVYWTTNSSLTLIQQLSLKNSFVRKKLGLSDVQTVKKKVLHIDVMDEESLQQAISAEALSPQDLFDFALEAFAAGDHDKACPLMRLAIEKDPESVRALIAMGQILFSKMSFEEAAEYFETAISKIQQDEEDDFLVLAAFGAGLSRVEQGRKSEGIQHLRRIAELKVPDSPWPKSCYYNGLMVLGSTLFAEGEKSEAAKYLKKVAAYNPDVNAYIKECEEG